MRFSICLVLVAMTSVSYAQEITTGSVEGIVTDRDTKEPLAAVYVTIGTQSAVTDGHGAYKVTDVVPGTYDVVFDMDPTRAVHKGVRVQLGQTLRLDEKLKIGEAIEIHGTPPPLDLRHPSHEKHFDRAYLDDMPVPGPNFDNVIGAIGGAQNDGVGTAFSGSTSLENRYIVDGVDITGLTFGNVGTPVPNAFIDDIQVITGGMDAEMGRATGGVVNLVTRNGTDTVRGSIFGAITPGFLTAGVQRAPVNASSIDVTPNQAYTSNFGVELGGPIVKGRAWWYVGVAPQLSRVDYTRTIKRETDCHVRLDNGSISTCEKQYADGVPDIDPATGFYLTDIIGHDTRTSTSRSFASLAKITAAPAEAQTVQASLIALPSVSDSPQLFGNPGAGRHTTGLTTDAVMKWNAKFDDAHTEVEALVAWHRSTLNSGAIDPALDAQPSQQLIGGDLATLSALGYDHADGCQDRTASDPYPLIVNCPLGTRGYEVGGPGALSHDTEDRRTARLSVTERRDFLGNHEMKAGIDVEDNVKSTARLLSGGAAITNYLGSDVRIQRWAALGEGSETCQTPGDSTGPNAGMKSYQCHFLGGTVGSPGTQVGGQTVDWAAFLRDSWRPYRTLTLNAGLRYEDQRLNYAESLRNTTDPLTHEHIGTTAMALTGNLAPRLGAIWDPSDEGKTKLFASWGRFYEAIPMDINDRSFGGEVSDVRDFAPSQCGASDPRLGGPDGRGCLMGAHPTTEQLIGSSGVLVAPGIQAEYVDEVLAGAEIAVIPNVVAGVTVQHRTLGRAIEDVSTDGANTYIIANPGEWSRDAETQLQRQIAMTSDAATKNRLTRELGLFQGIRTFDKPSRNYDAIELSLSRRFTSGLYLQGSYTYSRAEGNYPGSVSYDNGQIDPNISSQYDLIELLANRRGPLPQDRPHSLKIDAYRGFEVGRGVLTIGTRIRAISGVPINALGPHYLYGPNESFLLPRGVLGRTGLEHGVDVHVGYRRKLSATTSAELYMDFFNIYNHQGTFNVDETYTPAISGGVNPISGGEYADLIWAKTTDKNGMETSQPTPRNPNFGHTTARYAPASAQVGFRVTF
ncbi:MAG: TonB-dependent receptor [Deltaproteobacteria bacterium]|nr:TonB-dependent receptor [Deltaproteobacteria bacterium]